MTCRYLNGCLKQWRPQSKVKWTSFSLSMNTQAQIHIDAHNYDSSVNMTCSLGKFTGGELWLEMKEEDHVQPRVVHWETKSNGVRVPGHLYSTYRQPLLVSPKTYHKTRAWKGTPWAMTAFTARSFRGLEPRDRDFLRSAGFPVPCDRTLPPAGGLDAH